MGDLSRRNVITAAAVGSVLAANTASVRAQDEKNEGAGEPMGWGKEGDQSFKAGDHREFSVKLNAKGGRSDAEAEVLRAARSNNCNSRKDEIRPRFRIVRFGSCSHPTPGHADVEAGALMAQVIADGGVLNTEFGHRTVKNKVGPIRFNTYLAYAGGDSI